MTAYTDSELSKLVADPESDLVERKESAADGRKIRRNICAFANDLPGHGRPGVVVVGVRDDGSCASLPIGDELLTRLADIHGDGDILPLPSMTVQKRTLGDCEVAVVTVQPARDTPVRYRGRVWVRVGPSVREGSVEDERMLAERRRASDAPFDMKPNASATLDDLDLDFVRQQYLTVALAQDVLERNARPLEQQMRSLRLVQGDRPTWGALLAFGRDSQAFLPGAYIQFLRIDGTSITAPLTKRKEITGRLPDVIRQLDETLDVNIGVRTEVAGHSREVCRADYPVDAIRQLAYNAIMHRSYEGTNTPIRVHWFADRIEVASPGGLYGRMTPQNFGTGDTDYRNPLLAEIMANLGFAQRFGLGLPLAREAMLANDNPPPEFRFEPSLVVAVLRAAA